MTNQSGNLRVAPRAGFEPATIRLTVGCDSISLLLMAFYALLETPVSIDFLSLWPDIAFQRATSHCAFLWPPRGPNAKD